MGTVTDFQSRQATPHDSRVDRLRQLIATARAKGARVRREWLGGATGGGCEIAGVRWLFLDLSLSIDEQIEQVAGAIEVWSMAEVQPPTPAGDTRPARTSTNG